MGSTVKLKIFLYLSHKHTHTCIVYMCNRHHTIQHIAHGTVFRRRGLRHPYPRTAASPNPTFPCKPECRRSPTSRATISLSVIVNLRAGDFRSSLLQISGKFVLLLDKRFFHLHPETRKKEIESSRETAGFEQTMDVLSPFSHVDFEAFHIPAALLDTLIEHQHTAFSLRTRKRQHYMLVQKDHTACSHGTKGPQAHPKRILHSEPHGCSLSQSDLRRSFEKLTTSSTWESYGAVAD